MSALSIASCWNMGVAGCRAAQMSPLRHEPVRMLDCQARHATPNRCARPQRPNRPRKRDRGAMTARRWGDQMPKAKNNRQTRRDGGRRAGSSGLFLVAADGLDDFGKGITGLCQIRFLCLFRLFRFAIAVAFAFGQGVFLSPAGGCLGVPAGMGRGRDVWKAKDRRCHSASRLQGPAVCAKAGPPLTYKPNAARIRVQLGGRHDRDRAGGVQLGAAKGH